MVCENINNVWISQECMGKQEAGEQRSSLSKNLSPTGDTIIPHSSLLIPHSSIKKFVGLSIILDTIIKKFDRRKPFEGTHRTVVCST